MKAALLVILIVPMLGCSEEYKTNRSINKVMGWLDSANPISDAEKAIKSNNCKLFAVSRLTFELPGNRALINNMSTNELANLYGFTVIEGTSDGLINNEHSRLNGKAMEYATIYNERVYSSSCFAHKKTL